MKKVTLAIVLVAVLATVGFAGVADGTPPQQSMDRAKLVGVGPNGYGRGWSPGPMPHNYWGTSFLITNPHPQRLIHIDGVVIRRFNGEVVYQGPLLYVDVKTDPENKIWYFEEVIGRYPVPALGREAGGLETVVLMLSLYMPDGEGGWLSNDEASNLFAENYTVEIGYRAPLGVQLMGTTITYQQTIDEAFTQETWMRGTSRTPMLNMELRRVVGRIGGAAP